MLITTLWDSHKIQYFNVGKIKTANNCHKADKVFGRGLPHVNIRPAPHIRPFWPAHIAFVC